MSSSIALIRIIAAAAAVVVWVRMQRVNFCRSVKTRPHSVNSEQPPPPQPPTMDARGFIWGVDIITNNNNIDNRTVQSYVVYQFLIIIKCDYKFNL